MQSRSLSSIQRAAALATLLLSLGWAKTADAALYLVDFGATTNMTTGGAQVWNNFTTSSDASSLALVSTLGVSEGYSLASNGSFSLLNEGLPAGTYPYAESVVRDAFFVSGTRIFTFAGLDPSQQYGLKVYGYVNRVDSRLTRVTVGSVTKSYEPGNTAQGNLSGGSVEFLGLTANGSGQLSFTTSTGTATNYILTALELYTVPEPQIPALLGFAGCLALARRRPRV